MPRFIVPVSTRTMKLTVLPETVVVFATSGGSVVTLGSGLNAGCAGPRPPPRAPGGVTGGGGAGALER